MDQSLPLLFLSFFSETISWHILGATHGVDVINKFHHNNRTLIGKRSNTTWNNKSECFISALPSYGTVHFVHDTLGLIPGPQQKGLNLLKPKMTGKKKDITWRLSSSWRFRAELFRKSGTWWDRRKGRCTSSWRVASRPRSSSSCGTLK